MLQLGSSSAEKDLRAVADSKLNMSLQCAPAAKVANSILDCINSSMASTGRRVIIPFCSALLRCHLEYHTQFQAPQYKKEVNQMDQVQMKVTKTAGVRSPYLVETDRSIWACFRGS